MERASTAALEILHKLGTTDPTVHAFLMRYYVENISLEEVLIILVEALVQQKDVLSKELVNQSFTHNNVFKIKDS